MIKRIVDADNEARALEEANKKEAEEQKQKISEEAKQIYDKYLLEAAETVKKNDAHQEHKAEKQWKEISAKQNSTLIKLQSDYEQNFDKWVDAIVNRVLE